MKKPGAVLFATLLLAASFSWATPAQGRFHALSPVISLQTAISHARLAASSNLHARVLGAAFRSYGAWDVTFAVDQQPPSCGPPGSGPCAKHGTTVVVNATDGSIRFVYTPDLKGYPPSAGVLKVYTAIHLVTTFLKKLGRAVYLERIALKARGQKRQLVWVARVRFAPLAVGMHGGKSATVTLDARTGKVIALGK